MSLFPHLKDIQCSDEFVCEQQLDEVCQLLSSGSNLPQASLAFDGKLWYSSLLYLSGLVAGFLFLVSWHNKELQVHPMKIFMHLALMESIIPISGATMNQICYFKLDYLFAYSVYFNDDAESRLKAAVLLGNTGSFLIQFGSTVEVLLLACLCYDLIQILRQPFANKEGRMKWYLMFSYSIGIAFSYISLLDMEP